MDDQKEYVTDISPDIMISAAEAIQALHEIGGTGAEKDSWADGWDSAITAAIDVIERMAK